MIVAGLIRDVEPKLESHSASKTSGRIHSPLYIRQKYFHEMSSNNEQHHGSKPNPRRSGERAKPPRQVDHTYHDFSHYPTDDLPPLSLAPTNFPTKLHHILSDPEYHHVSETSFHH